MTQQTINLGTMPNAGDGDKLRIAFEKINENFDELYPLLAQVAGILGGGIVTPQNLLAAVNALSGTSVRAVGAGALEALMPVQTVAGATRAFGAGDLYRETRRANAGAAMIDVLPPASAAGLVNGTTVQINNADTAASLTLSAGLGTQIMVGGNAVTTVVVGPGRSTRWVYDAASTAWRPTMNSLSALLIANALSEIAAAGATAQASARTNLALGTAATQAVGTAAGNVVQLDGSSRLPAVDGSQLTNLPSTALAKASTAQAQAGTDDAAYMTALKVFQAVAALAGAAAASDIWANVANKVAAPASLWAAAAPVIWTYAATYAPDMATFLSARMTLTGNLTLANPTNMKPGQAGEIILTQDATGSRTIAFGSVWKFIGGTPTASTAANATDVLSYRVVTATLIIGSYGKNVA